MNAYFLSFLRRSEYATMPTEQAITDLLPKNRRFFKVPVVAISNGIDLSRFAKGRANSEIYEKYDIPKKAPIVLYVGRVDPEKSLDVLMYAFVDVLQKVPDAHLVIVGDGTARRKLEEIAEEEEISSHVHFTGRVVGDDLPQIYRTATVFAITSKTETQSIVVMEAMASGLPLLCKKDDCLCNVVENGKNGFTWDSREEFYSHLDRLISNPQLRKQIGYEAMQTVKQKYTVLGFSLSCIEIYQKMIQSYHNSDLSDP